MSSDETKLSSNGMALSSNGTGLPLDGTTLSSNRTRLPLDGMKLLSDGSPMKNQRMSDESLTDVDCDVRWTLTPLASDAMSKDVAALRHEFCNNSKCVTDTVLQLVVLRCNFFFKDAYFTLHPAVRVFEVEAFAQEKKKVSMRERV